MCIRDRIATAYLVERDGTIYEVFDPLYWAHHLGLKVAKNVLYNKTSIGIELASEGALRSGAELNSYLPSPVFDVEYLYAFDIDKPPFARAKKLYHGFHDNDLFVDLVLEFRGYKFFDSYNEAQVVATIALVKHLCEQFSIPKVVSATLEFDPKWMDFAGVITHANVREDKSDLCPAWDWVRLSLGIM